MTCKKCKGTGSILGDRPTWVPDVCPSCVEKGICPKCSIKMIYDDDTAAVRCPSCGYDEATGEIVKKEAS